MIVDRAGCLTRSTGTQSAQREQRESQWQTLPTGVYSASVEGFPRSERTRTRLTTSLQSYRILWNKPGEHSRWVAWLWPDEGESDMSGHRVQFADLPPSDHKGSPKFHSKANYWAIINLCWPWFPSNSTGFMYVGKLLKSLVYFKCRLPLLSCQEFHIVPWYKVVLLSCRRQEALNQIFHTNP